MNLKRLREPFPAADIEWRIQQAGISNGKPWAMVLAYVDARACQDRLDEVFGADGWQTDFTFLDDGVLCRLKCKCNMQWVTKQDGSPQTKVEAFKGGISKAMVRTASQWGIGRYLYDLKTNFADCSLDRQSGPEWKKHFDAKSSTPFWWKPPALPEWALPGENKLLKQLQHTIKLITGNFKNKEKVSAVLDVLKISNWDELNDFDDQELSEVIAIFDEWAVIED